MVPGQASGGNFKRNVLTCKSSQTKNLPIEPFQFTSTILNNDATKKNQRTTPPQPQLLRNLLTPKAFYTRSDLCHKPSTPEIRLHQHLCARSWRKIWNLFTPATFAWRAWHMTPKAVYSRSPFQSFHTRNLTMQNAMRIRACKHKNTATLEVGF